MLWNVADFFYIYGKLCKVTHFYQYKSHSAARVNWGNYQSGLDFGLNVHVCMTHPRFLVLIAFTIT